MKKEILTTAAAVTNKKPDSMKMNVFLHALI